MSSFEGADITTYLAPAFLGEEQTGRLDDVLCANLIPSEFVGVLAGRHTDLLAVDDELRLLDVSLNRALELTMHRVILQHVGQIVNGAEVIDAHDLDVRTILSSAENETADTTETVNTNFNHLK